jgi:S1-C subfamily serine protease
MAFYGPRPPLMERLRTAARHPFVAALLGGLVVLLLGVVLIAAGAVGGEDKTTVVQSPIAEPATNASSSSKGLTVNQIYDQAGPGVAYVRAEVVQQSDNSIFGLPQTQRGEATGSGFVIDKEGDVLTNAHVVEGARKVTVDLGSKTFDAKIVGRDASSDVALLKVDAGGTSLKPLALGDSSKIQVGDPVVAIGNPFGLDRTVTTGIVSALQRQLKAPNGFTIEHVIQTDAAINPGNSGGPLIDSHGRVVGINSQIATAGGNGSIGIGFAVPIDTAKKIADQLKQSGKVQHAFLGVTGVAITKSMSDSLNLPTDKGVLVQQVTGPAKKAGIKGGDTQVTIRGADVVLGGDVILEINGKTVKSMNDVIGVVDSKKPGEQVSLKLLRGSKQRSATVELGNRPQNADQSFQQNQDQQLPPGLSP